MLTDVEEKIATIAILVLFIESAFSRIRCFINRLASLERKRLDLEQQFNKVLTNWNGAEGNMESPRFQING